MTYDDKHRANLPDEAQSSGGRLDVPRGAAENSPSQDGTRTNGTSPLGPTPETDTAGEGTIVDAKLAPPRRVAGAVVAWLVIITMVYLSIALRQVPEEASDEPFDRTELLLLEFQAKYLVGAAELPTLSDGQLAATASELDRGPLANRLGYVVLLGELDGPKAAVAALVRLDRKIEESDYLPPKELAEVIDVLEAMYGDYEDELWQAPSLTDAQRQMLVAQLGWFGELALAPAEHPDQAQREVTLEPARRTVIVLMTAASGGTLALLGGLGGLFAFAALVTTGRIRSSLGSTASDGNVYVETFALWMVLFAALSVLAAVMAGDDESLLAPLVAMLLSLSALLWPLVRGIAPGQMRRDVGLTARRSGIVELFWGLVCYASTLPLLLLGVTITVALTRLTVQGGGAPADEFAPTSVPSHPLIQWVADAGPWGAVQIILVACVAAPLVEETMFRGVLYRHLREATVRMRVGWSVLASTALNAFIFAIIHPQGLLAVPPLMALAVGFSLAREWRGSLLAPMTAHAVNNGVVTLMLLSIL